MNLLFGILALAGFTLALLVHGLTFAHVDVASAFPYIWLLHIGCFVVFIPFFFISRNEYGNKPSASELLAQIPSWARVLIKCTFAYAIINFALFILHSAGGSPAEGNGVFKLQDHGRIIRVLTESEYHLQRAYVIRGFSGHWLVFYLVAAIYFLFRQSRGAAKA